MDWHRQHPTRHTRSTHTVARLYRGFGFKESFLVLAVLSSALLSGCIFQQQQKPGATLNEIQGELRSTEQRMADDIHKIREAQQQQQDRLASIEEKMEVLRQGLPKTSPASNTDSPTSKSVVVSQKPCKFSDQKTPDGRLILGRVEWVLVAELNDYFKARVDTGATTSSISADKITQFERDGKRWVKFMLTHDGTDNVPLEAKLVRYARIRQASADEPERRPVVKLNIRIGDSTESAEFTLTNRSSMTYPILLGREFLKDVALVDVAKKYVHGQPAKPEAPQGKTRSKKAKSDKKAKPKAQSNEAKKPVQQPSQSPDKAPQ